MAKSQIWSGSAWIDLYTLPSATSSVLGGVKVGSNITVSSGVISLTKANVTSALGYTPLQTHQDITGKLDKTTYQWNKEIAFGSTGMLCIGKFPMYDSQLSVEIKATTTTTYYGVLVIATQNVKNTQLGTLTATVFGDANNEITPNIYIEHVSGSNMIGVYFRPTAWSKNLIHIQAQALNTNPNYGSTSATDICTSISAIPSTATKQPTNALTANFNKYSLPTATSSALGGIKLGYTDSGKNYKVQVDGSGNAYVNVPWTNPAYSDATTSASGLMSATDKTNLNTLVALLADNDTNTTVDTIREVLNVFASYPEGTTIANALAGKLDKSGGTLTGTVTMTAGDFIARYVAVKDATHETTTTYGKIVTLSSSGYIRYRTPAEIRSDVGLGNVLNVASYSKTEVDNLLAGYLPISGNTTSNLMKDITLQSGSGLYWYTISTKQPFMLYSNYTFTLGNSDFVTVLKGTIVGIEKLKTITAPTTSGGSTYGNGTNGQVLTSNGTNVYWGTPSGGGMTMECIYSAAGDSSFSITDWDQYKFFIIGVNGYGDMNKYVIIPRSESMVVYHVTSDNQVDYIQVSYSGNTATFTNNGSNWGAWGFYGDQYGVK